MFYQTREGWIGWSIATMFYSGLLLGVASTPFVVEIVQGQARPWSIWLVAGCSIINALSLTNAVASLSRAWWLMAIAAEQLPAAITLPRLKRQFCDGLWVVIGCGVIIGNVLVLVAWAYYCLRHPVGVVMTSAILLFLLAFAGWFLCKLHGVVVELTGPLPVPPVSQETVDG